MRAIYQPVVVFSAVIVSTLVGCGSNGVVAWGPELHEDSDVNHEADLRLSILTPHDGAEIHSPVFKELTGVVENLPSNWSIYVFASDEFRYYLQFPAARCDQARGTFYHRNIRLSATVNQQFDLHACAVTREAARRLDARAARNDWSGMQNLPEGVYPLDSVTVTRVP